MRLHNDNYGFDSNLPKNERECKIENSAKMFSILSDGLYTDKILTVIREYICNAFDAHLDANKPEVPITVHMPSRITPTFYVEDEGTGIHPDKIGDIFWTYGASTKTEREELTGALGLGSKSAFAYTKSSFIVKNRFQGTEYVYFVYINQRGYPASSQVGEAPTTKTDGITVEFAVHQGDINVFFDRMDRYMKYWPHVTPKFINCEPSTVKKTKVEKIIQGTGWFLETQNVGRDHYGAYVIQGNVPYPVVAESIPNLPDALRIIARNAFVITVPLGSVGFAASREALSYDEFTCKNLIERLEQVRLEISSSFKAQVFKAGQTQLEFMKNFSVTFKQFSKTFKISGNMNSPDDDERRVRLLVGKNTSDVVSYAGHEYKIDDLIHDTFNVTRSGHQPFGILVEHIIGRSARVSIKAATEVLYITSEDVEQKDLWPDSLSSLKTISTGHEIRNMWFSGYLKPNSKLLTFFDRILSKQSSFDVKTTTKIKLREFTDLIFVINDVGSSGEGRFKSFISKQSKNQYLFVRHNQKEITLERLKSEVKSFIDDGLTGAKIVMISELPDMRPVIEREKIMKGSIKLSYLSFDAYPTSKTSTVIQFNRKVYIPNIDYETPVNKDKKVGIFDTEKLTGTVLYVLKNRSKHEIFDVRSGHGSIVADKNILGLGSRLGILDDHKVTNISRRGHISESTFVLVLNENQVKWLTNHKVKLISVKDLFISKLEKMLLDESFIDKVSMITALENTDSLDSICGAVNKYPRLKGLLNVADSTSVFKQCAHDYFKIKDNAALQGQITYFAMYDLYKKLSLPKTANMNHAHQLNEKINKAYPVLELISRLTDEKDLISIIDYIELVDAKVEVAEEEVA